MTQSKFGIILPGCHLKHYSHRKFAVPTGLSPVRINLLRVNASLHLFRWDIWYFHVQFSKYSKHLIFFFQYPCTLMSSKYSLKSGNAWPGRALVPNVLVPVLTQSKGGCFRKLFFAILLSKSSYVTVNCWIFCLRIFQKGHLLFSCYDELLLVTTGYRTSSLECKTWFV